MRRFSWKGDHQGTVTGIHLGLLLGFSITSAAPNFDPGKAGFSVQYHGERSPYRVNGVFVLPKEELRIEVKDDSRDSFSLSIAAGQSEQIERLEWTWTAPDTVGAYPITIRRNGSDDSIRLNTFVMATAGEIKNGALKGYRIGSYPGKPLKALKFYLMPEGFIKLDQATAGIQVSPHFKLGQFACKQPSGPVSYLVLREKLLLKLESILEEANQHGYSCQTFHIMSGYRTPFYNHLIGNVKWSVHQWGGAADIFIDEHPEDGEMDDLNGDGKVDGDDSEILFQLVDRLSLSELFFPYIGGLGKYVRSKTHGPFIHVDVRGFKALW